MAIARVALDGNVDGYGSDGEHYDGDARGCVTGAPIDLPDFRGETALIMAAFSDRIDVVFAERAAPRAARRL